VFCVELLERDLVVAEVRKWVGTPYHCQADVLGAGVDCGMLIVRVFVDCGLCEPFDPRPYSDDWFFHRSEERYLEFVYQHCEEVQIARRGDIMVFRYGRCYSHGGIVTVANPLTIAHAYQPAKCVIEEIVECNSALSQVWRQPRFFSYWG
jgi:NlpC/P60 family putative phage cell wall peptidase